MKTYFSTFALALLTAVWAPPAGAAPADDVNRAQVAQAIASKDPGQVASVLPVIEKLWPQQPNEYLESVKNAAGVLDAATARDSVRPAISNLFASMIQKTIPGTADSAAALLEAKRDTILYFLNFSEVREDQTNLLAMAGYIGTLRDQITPNYVPKPVYLNPPGLMGATPARAQQLIRDNEQNKTLNEWQQTLETANIILTFHLLDDAARFSAADPHYTGFIREITKAARLSDEEQRQL